MGSVGRACGERGYFFKGSCGWGFCLSDEREGRRKREKCLMGFKERRKEDFDFDFS